jgi:thiaminase/transcriptional activator TenA
VRTDQSSRLVISEFAACETCPDGSLLHKALLLIICAVSLRGATFTDQLWRDVIPIYEKTLAHPYLKGLADGTLPRSRFEFYLIQDAHYLRAFGQALNVIASKAPREEWAITLSRHSVETLEVERQLHENLLQQFGVSRERMAAAEVAPSTYAYTSHLLAVAHKGTFAEALAAVLPCYRIYWEVGKELAKAGSKNPAYQRWIDQYADPAYGKTVQQVLAMMDAQAGAIGEQERIRARRYFVISARYEYLFWDAAWREERWLP